jgi:hypothetical protein
MDNFAEINVSSYASNIREYAELEQITTEGEETNGLYIL